MIFRKDMGDWEYISKEKCPYCGKLGVWLEWTGTKYCNHCKKYFNRK